MRDTTLAKCRKAKELIDSGLSTTSVMKKMGMGINTYYQFLDEKRPKTTKISVSKSESKRQSAKPNPLIVRVLNSNLNREDKIVLCAGLV